MIDWRSTVLAAACVTGLVLAGTATALSQGATISLRAHNTLCVTAGGGLGRFNKIVLDRCVGEVPQLFTYVPRSGQIRAAAGGLCIDLDRSPDGPETLHLVRCDGQDQTMHRWSFDAATGLVRYASDNICWDVPKGNFRSGQKLEGSRCVARSANQQFVMNKPAPAAAQATQRPSGQQLRTSAAAGTYRANPTCPAPGKFKSMGNVASTIVFNSRLNQPATVYWLDSNGQPVPYGKLLPNQSLKFNTFFAHHWVVQDATGRCHGQFGLFMAGMGSTNVTVRP